MGPASTIIVSPLLRSICGVCGREKEGISPEQLADRLKGLEYELASSASSCIFKGIVCAGCDRDKVIIDASAHALSGHPQCCVSKSVPFHCGREKEGISPEQLADGLKSLGYELAQSELGVLMDQISLDQHGQVAKPAFLASQVDWQDFQQNFK